MTTAPNRHPLDSPRLILAGYVYTRINGKVTRRYALTDRAARLTLISTDHRTTEED